MASTLGAIRNILSDRYWVLKLGLFIGAYFYLRNQEHLWNPSLNEQTALMFQGILFVILLGCANISMHRNINNIEPFIPGLKSIPEIIIKSILSIIVAIPGLILAYALYIFISNTFIFQEKFVEFVVYVIAGIIMSAFIFIPVILLSVRGNIHDAMRFDIIFKGAGNFIVKIMGLAIVYSLFMGFITYVLYNFILEMLGDHPALLLLQCTLIIFTFYVFFSFGSDLYGDGIPEIDLKEKYGPKRRGKAVKKNLKR